MIVATTGPSGRLGSQLVNSGCISLDCDITNVEETEQAIAKTNPDVIINTAAWTAVDEAEKPENYDKVIATNTRGPANVRRAFNGLMIQISTGFVFNGKNGPNNEEDDPEPVNLYGMSKLGGEAAAKIRQPTIIVRVLDLFGPNSNGHSDFVRQIRDALELGIEKELPDRLFGTPTYTTHLIEALMQIATRWGVMNYNLSDGGLSDRPEILHVAGNLTLSRADWGKRIAEAFGHDPALIVPTSEIKGLAPRPLRGGLNVARAESLGIPIYSPLDGLAALKQWEQARGEQDS